MSKIKGITVEIGGNTVGLSKALGNAKKESNSLQKELREVDKLLKLDPKNTELLTQKQKLLTQSVDGTKEKLEALKAAKEKADADMANGTEINEKQYRTLQREIVGTEQELKRLKEQTKDFGSVTEQRLKSAGQSMQNFGDKVSGAGEKLLPVTAVIAGLGGLSYKSAAELEDAMGATDQIFKNSADSVKNWATNLESYFGIAKGEAVEYANMMGTMLQEIGGLTEEEAAKQAQTLIELAGDLTAMYGGTTAEAVRALTGALKGNNTMLDNYGMAVNDAMLKTKALEMGLYDGTGQIDLAAKQAATLALVMEQSGAAQGQAAREAEGASGTMRSFSTVVKNLSAIFGEVLLPVITPIIQKIADLIKRMGEFDDDTKKTIVTVVGIVAAIGPLLIIIGKMSTGIGALIKVYGVLSTALKGTAAAQATLNATMKANVIGLVLMAVAGLVLGIGSLIKAQDSATTETKKLCKEIRQLGIDLDESNETIGKNLSLEEAKAKQAKELTAELYALNEQVKSGTLSESDANDVKKQMHGIAEQLKSLIPQVAIEFDKETGAIKTQRGEIESLIDSVVRLARAKAAASLLEKAQITLLEAEMKGTEAVDKYEKAAMRYTKLTSDIEKGNSGVAVEAREELRKVQKAMAESSAVANEVLPIYEKAKKQVTDLTKIIAEESLVTEENTSTTKTNTTAAKQNAAAKVSGGKSAAAATKSAAKEVDAAAKTEEQIQKELTKAYEEERSRRFRDLKFSLDMELISEGEYYSELEKLRDEYFEDGADEWQRYTLEIYNYRKKIQVDAAAEIAKDLAGALGDIGLTKDKSSLEYRLWAAAYGTTATEAERLHKQGESLTEQYNIQGKTVDATQAAYNKMVAEYGEAYEGSRKLYNQLLKEQAAYVEIKNSIYDVRDEAGKLGKVEIGRKLEETDLEYRLWVATHGETATEAEKLQKQEESLTRQHDLQGEVVSETEKAYKKMVEQYGEAYEGSRELYKQLQQEKIAYQELHNSIMDVRKAKEANLSEAQYNYADYLRQNYKTLAGFGISAEDIFATARSVSGLDKAEADVKSVTVNQTITTTAATPSEVREAARDGVTLATKEAYA